MADKEIHWDFIKSLSDEEIWVPHWIKMELLEIALNTETMPGLRSAAVEVLGNMNSAQARRMLALREQNETNRTVLVQLRAHGED